MRLCRLRTNNELLIFHTWGYGVPRNDYKNMCNSEDKDCTVAIVEDEYGRVFNVIPEKIYFLDTKKTIQELTKEIRPFYDDKDYEVE